MASLGDLIVKLKADAKDFEAGLDKASKRLGAAGDKMKSLGTGLSAAVTLPILGIGAAIVATAGEFEASVNKLRGLSSDTGESFDRLKDKAKLLGSTTSFSAAEAAQGMIALTQAGLGTDQVLSGIDGTLTLAAAGSLELGRASEIAANTMAQFNLDADQAGRIGNVLAATAQSATTDIEQLAQGFKFAGTAADASGLSLEETAGILGIFANKAIQGSMGGERLRTILGALAKPSKVAADALAAAGVAVSEVNIEARGLPAVLETLKQANLSTAASIDIFGIEAKDAANVLINEGSEGFRQFTANLTGTDAATKQAAANMLGFQGAMKELKSATEGMAIAIAESGLLDFLTGLVKQVTAFVSELSKTNPEILKWGTVIAGVAAVIGPLVAGVGVLVAAVSALSAPVLVAVAGIAALTAAIAAAATFIETDENFLAPWNETWEDIKLTVTEVTDRIGVILDEFTGVLEAIWELPGLKQTVEFTWEAIKSIVSGVMTALGGVIRGALDVITGIFRTFRGVFTGDWQTAWDGIKLIFEGIWTAIGGVFTGALEGIIGTAAAGIDAVTGLFSDLKDELVGNSIVPDMLDGIQGQFERLGGLAMLTPATDATGGVGTAFSDMGTKLMGAGGLPDTVKGVQAEFGKMRDAVTAPGTGLRDALGKAFDDIGGKVTDVIGKLGTGDLSLRGAFDALKNVGKDLLDNVLKGILSNLTDLSNLEFPGLGGIFGGGGGGSSVPGGGGAGAGATASGLSGTLGAVFGGIGAASSIFGNFQNAKMETTLNAIEGNTRFAALFLGGAADGGIRGIQFRVLDALLFGTNVKANEQTRDFIRRDLPELRSRAGKILNELREQVTPLLSAMNDSLTSLAQPMPAFAGATAGAAPNVTVNVTVQAGAESRSRSGTVGREVADEVRRVLTQEVFRARRI